MTTLPRLSMPIIRSPGVPPQKADRPAVGAIMCGGAQGYGVQRTTSTCWRLRPIRASWSPPWPAGREHQTLMGTGKSPPSP